MLYFTTFELLFLLLALPLIGGVFGYFFAGDRMRRQSGGKTPAELRAELDDYQRNVSNHFQQSAELLQQMTAQYREIYTHMAHGAAELCGEAESSPEVEALKRLSVALDDAAALPSPAATAAHEAESHASAVNAGDEAGGAVDTPEVESTPGQQASQDAASASGHEATEGVVGGSVAETTESAENSDRRPAT